MSHKILRFLFVLIVCVMCIEGGLRILGYGPYEVPEINIRSVPESSILPDSSKGFRLNEGEFNITLNEGLQYKVTHLNGTRITRSHTNTLNPNATLIGFFGCSFTYGYGINDEESFPYLIQQELKDVNVSNFAIPGTGTIHSLLSIEDMRLKGTLPNIVILCFASFHLERDLLSPSYQEKLSIGLEQSSLNFESDSFYFPYGQISDDSLIISKKNAKNFVRVGWLRKNSALTNYLNDFFRSKTNYSVTLKALNRIHQICSENNSELILACLTDDSYVEKFCRKNKISYWNITVPIHEKGMNLMPYDPHPNSKAAYQYAQAILENLESEYNIN